ncbi:MAG TPA: hypothetical protein VJA40_00260 [archaeon]|nr:hypothetical protein [archaeon]
MDLSKFEAGLEAFDRELFDATYPNLVGLSDKSSASEVFARHAELFSKNAVREALKKVQAAGKGNSLEVMRSRFYLKAALEGLIGVKTAKLRDEVLKVAATSTVKVSGRKTPFRSVSLESEANSAKRKKISDACSPVHKKLSALELKALKSEYAAFKEFGFAYNSFYDLVKNVDHAALAKKLKYFLVASETQYNRELSKRLDAAKVKPKDAGSWDIAFLLKGREFDKFFPKNKALEVLHSSLEAMGLDLKAMENVSIDAVDRPKKRARAFVLCRSVPGEVFMVAKPFGGCNDYSVLLHESGHALHHAFTSPSLPYLARSAGGIERAPSDYALTETYAFLFNNLRLNEQWVKEHFKMPHETTKAYMDFARFQQLFYFRYLVAKLVYELKLHSNDLRVLNEYYEPTAKKHKNFAECYASILGQALKVKHSKDKYLLVDPGFYSADYCRAFLAEAQLRRYLERNFGRDWFKQDRAGAFLKELWSRGNAMHVDELMARLDYAQGLDFKVFARDFERFGLRL